MTLSGFRKGVRIEVNIVGAIHHVFRPAGVARRHRNVGEVYRLENINMFEVTPDVVTQRTVVTAGERMWSTVAFITSKIAKSVAPEPGVQAPINRISKR